MLEKQRLKMNVNPLSVQYPGVDSEIMFHSDDFTQDLNIRYEDWKDMGSPNVVTVTVEPGDKLNPETEEIILKIKQNRPGQPWPVSEIQIIQNLEGGFQV